MKEQHQPKLSKKQKARLPLSAYLSYLLIATLLLTAVSFSKFASSGYAEDGARVAVVVVDGGSYDDETDLSIGGDNEAYATYSFYLTNSDVNGQTAEVALDYTVSVTMPEGRSLPDGVDVSLTYKYDVFDDAGDWIDTAEIECDPIPTEESGVYTFEGGDDFAAGEWAQHNYTLTFTMIDEDLVTEDYEFADIEISVKAEQIE